MGEDSFVEDEKLRRVMRRETKRFITTVHDQVHVADATERHARRAIEPRKEPERVTVAAKLPSGIVETAELMAEEAAPPAEFSVERIHASEPAGDDDVFNFFQ